MSASTPARTGAQPPRVDELRAHFEGVLDTLLPAADQEPERLHEAMRYSALAAGKRFRPLLVYAAGEALEQEFEVLDPVAAAVELIHAYSLIHDDLPAMDDDDLRRGRPTCHRAFDEATAILAGDALQALAFEVLADDLALRRRPVMQSQVILALARACGSLGMAGGQMLDLAAVGQSLARDALIHMHEMKTGALIHASVMAPALLAAAPAPLMAALDAYGRDIGLAFQIHDDVLDVTGDTERLGKHARADQARGKPTFPSTLGLEESRTLAAELRDRALEALDALPGDCQLLTWLAHHVVEREG
ncbi:MAG: polyprenyl synthetase family protein [Xanthomonadales bacterium]|nr:polyprenyl synthetase family protein [Xanthomonadales bacterium]